MPVNNIPDIAFTDIIDNNPNTNTSGYFKELMTSISGFIADEYQNGRITGSDYANVYLGAMQYALQNTTQYALQKEVQNQQIELLAAQTDETLASTIRNDNITNAQLANTAADTALKTSQELEVRASTTRENNKSAAYVSNQTADTTLKGHQSTLTSAKSTTESKQQNVLDSQVLVYTNQAKAFKAKHSRDVLESVASLATVNAGMSGEVEVLGLGIGGTTVSTAITDAKVWPASAT